MDWIQFTRYGLYSFMAGLTTFIIIWPLRTAVRKMFQSKLILTLIQILALSSLVILAFEYFPKWFGS